MYCVGRCCGYICSVPSCFRRGTGWAEIPGSGRREFLPLLPSDIVAIIIWIVLYVYATGRQAFSYRKVDMGSLTCETDMGSLTCETVLVRAVHTNQAETGSGESAGVTTRKNKTMVVQLCRV